MPHWEHGPKAHPKGCALGPGILGNAAVRSSKDTFWRVIRARVTWGILPAAAVSHEDAQGECFEV